MRLRAYSQPRTISSSSKSVARPSVADVIRTNTGSLSRYRTVSVANTAEENSTSSRTTGMDASA